MKTVCRGIELVLVAGQKLIVHLRVVSCSEPVSVRGNVHKNLCKLMEIQKDFEENFVAKLLVPIGITMSDLAG